MTRKCHLFLLILILWDLPLLSSGEISVGVYLLHFSCLPSLPLTSGLVTFSVFLFVNTYLALSSRSPVFLSTVRDQTIVRHQTKDLMDARQVSTVPLSYTPVLASISFCPYVSTYTLNRRKWLFGASS